MNIPAWMLWIGGPTTIGAILMWFLTQFGGRHRSVADVDKVKADALKTQADVAKVYLEAIAAADEQIEQARKNGDGWYNALVSLRAEAAARAEAQQTAYDIKLTDVRSKLDQALTEKRIVEDRLTEVRLNQYEVDTARRQNAEYRDLKIFKEVTWPRVLRQLQALTGEVRRLGGHVPDFYQLSDDDAVAALRHELDLAQDVIRQNAQNTERPND